MRNVYSMIHKLKQDLSKEIMHGECVEVFIGSLDDTSFVVEASFKVTDDDLVDELIIAYSYTDINVIFMEDDKYIYSKIIRDIINDVTERCRQDAVLH